MRAVGFIFVRSGSKGLPGKNLMKLEGISLLGRAIRDALAVNRIDRVIVSTDSQHIADEALYHGAEVPFIRPSELAADNSPEWLSWQHALNYLIEDEGGTPDAMVVIPATSPLRIPLDIERCLDEYERGDVDIVITMTPSSRSPYFNMVKINENNRVELVIKPVSNISHRQDAPDVFDICTIAYVARPAYVLNSNYLFEGRVRAVEIPNERSIDIDTIHDFNIAKMLLGTR